MVVLVQGDEEGERERRGKDGRRGLGEFFSFPASVSWDAKREDRSDVPLYLRRPVQAPSTHPLPPLDPPPHRPPYPTSVLPLFKPRSILPQPPLRLGFLPQRSLRPSYSPYVSRSYG